MGKLKIWHTIFSCLFFNKNRFKSKYKIMGASSSQENQAIKKKQKKFYAPPSYRIKTRFDAIDRTNLISAYEAAIDKVKNFINTAFDISHCLAC